MYMKHNSNPFIILILPQIILRSFIGAAILIMLSPLAGNAQNLLSNGSFETLSQSVPNSAYTTTFGSLPTSVATDWTLGTSGANGNQSFDGIATAAGGPVSNFNPMTIADGTNAVFLQGSGTVSQTLNLNTGQYTLSYDLMGRAGSAGNYINEVTASLSGGLVNDTETPANTDVTSPSDWTLYTDNFTVTTAGSYTLQFTGDYPYGVTAPDGQTDHTTFLDNASIVAVPEPSILALAEFCLIGLLFVRRHSLAKR
jgi:hypothetical protein